MSNTSAPRSRQPQRLLGIVATALLVVLLAGGAFAAGRATAPAASAGAVSAGAAAVRRTPARVGSMMGWATTHHSELGWAQRHGGDLAWMQHHYRAWSWMRLHWRAMATWMQQHRSQQWNQRWGRMERMHDWMHGQ